MSIKPMTETEQLKQALLALLEGKTIAYRIEFTKLTGSVHAGLFLSQAYYWQGKGKDTDGWFYKSEKDWEEETGLSRYYQRKAREKLVELGLLETKLRGVPATLYYRLDLDTLVRLFSKATVAQLDRQPLPDKSGKGSPTISESTIRVPETTLPASEDAGQLNEPEVVPCDDEGNELDLSGKPLPRYLRPELPIHHEVLKVRKAKKFTATRQKSRLTGLSKAMDAAQTLAGIKGAAVMYQTCLAALEKADSKFIKEPLPPIPSTWLAFRLGWAKEKRWSIARTVDELFSRQALMSHCHYHLKREGVPVPEESYEDRCRRKGWTQVSPGVWEDQR